VIASRAELLAALTATPAGSVVEIGPGAYGAVTLAKPVTLRGPADAVLESLTLGAKASGSTVEGLSVRLHPTATTPLWGSVVRLSLARDVVLRGLTIRSGLAPKGSVQAGRLVARGITLDRCERVTVDGCDIAEVNDGIVPQSGADLTLIGNHIHDTRGSPISGAATQRLRILDNHFADVRPAYDAGDHADFIHIWTVKDGQPIRGLEIVGNLLDEGAGLSLLGIYLDDNDNGVGFRDAVVERNTVLLSNHQAIRLENVTGRVGGNLLMQTGGEPKVAPAVILRNGSDVQITGNRLADPRGLLGLDASNETVPPGVQPREALALARWVWSRP
jgi:polygalacturonase